MRPASVTTFSWPHVLPTSAMSLRRTFPLPGIRMFAGPVVVTRVDFPADSEQATVVPAPNSMRAPSCTVIFP